MSNSLKNTIRKQRKHINFSGKDDVMERPVDKTSEESKRIIWKDFIRSHRSKAHTQTTEIHNTSGNIIGTTTFIMLSLFVGQRATSNHAVTIGQRTIIRMNGSDKAEKDEIELEHGYQAYIETAKQKYLPEANETFVQVFVTEFIDPISGKTEGKYVKMSQADADAHYRKESDQSKAGVDFVNNMFADPANREAFSKFLAQKGTE